MTMPCRASQFTVVARRLVVAMVIAGLLSVPATCSQAAGPHSVYLPPDRPAPAPPHQRGPVIPMHAAIPDRFHAIQLEHAAGLHSGALPNHALLALDHGRQLPGSDSGARLSQQLAVKELPSPAMMAMALVAALPTEPGVTLSAQDSPFHDWTHVLHGRSVTPISPPPWASFASTIAGARRQCMDSP